MIPKLLTPDRSLDLAYRRQNTTHEQFAQFHISHTTLLCDVAHTVAQSMAYLRDPAVLGVHDAMKRYRLWRLA